MSGYYPEQSKKSYLTMSNYYNDIFSYETRTDVRGKTTGSLSLLGSSLSNSCSQGHFLVENGKKLYPGGSYPGISTLMVGVHDAATGVKGFIDPNSYAFTNFSSERPAASIDPNPLRVGVNPNGSLIEDDQAPPVYTHGDILADGSAVIGGSITTPSTIVGGYVSSINTITAGTGVVVSTGQIRVNNVVTVTPNANNFVIDPTLGQVFKMTTVATGIDTITSVNESAATGGIVHIILSNGVLNKRIDFNNNFRSLFAGNFFLGQNTLNTFSFVCDGTALYQTGYVSTISQ
jgi:hypothetical protein